ncbi:MAG: hypothetical protein ACRELY_16260, partial [Polyangiaceae bacterium]
GESVSSLYFVNTLGSGLASAAAVVVFLKLFGQEHTLFIAAACNFVAGLGSLGLHLLSKKSPQGETA